MYAVTRLLPSKHWDAEVKSFPMVYCMPMLSKYGVVTYRWNACELTFKVIHGHSPTSNALSPDAALPTFLELAFKPALLKAQQVLLNLVYTLKNLRWLRMPFPFRLRKYVLFQPKLWIPYAFCSPCKGSKLIFSFYFDLMPALIAFAKFLFNGKALGIYRI